MVKPLSAIAGLTCTDMNFDYCCNYEVHNSTLVRLRFK